MNKLGVQCQGGTGNALEYNRIVKPAAIKAINVKEAAFWDTAIRDNPDGLRVLRRYPNFDGWDLAPEYVAMRAVQTYQDEFGHLLGNGRVTHIEDNNEWQHSFMCKEMDAADRYMATFIDATHDKWKGKVHAIVGNFACGHFSNISWEHCRNDIGVFEKTLHRLNDCPLCFLGSHEYDWPTMWRLYDDGLAAGDGGMWLCLKFLRIQRRLDELGLLSVQQCITEAGVDSGAAHQYPNLGWRRLHPDINEARRLFLRCLHRYYDAIMRHPRLVFAALFGYGLDGDWGSFNLDYQTVQEIGQFKLYPTMEVR